MRNLQAVLLATFLAMPAAAQAQTDYTADDIVKHFEPATKTGKDGQKTRGVTFGPTGFGDDKDGASPDSAAKPAVADPGAFNLSITFKFNSDQLTGQAQRNLRQFAEALRRPEMGTFRFAVDGHTDASGPESYNQGLSERRARAVVTFLAAEGIDPSRLQARGFGEARPAVDNPRDRRNRRVETRLLD